MSQTIKRVYTENSIYEVDEEDNRIRRVNSNHEPTPRQEEDGVWQEFGTVEGLEEGSPMLIIWGSDEDEEYLECTHTSTIQKIVSEVDLNDNS